MSLPSGRDQYNKHIHVQKRFQGGGAGPRQAPVVKAVCLSLVGDPVHLERLWSQEWVQSWEGWKELEEDGSDDKAIELAHRFLRIAGMNIPTTRKSNRQRLKELEVQKGLRLHVASSHGVNNCLIDSLLLGLVAAGLAPQGMTVAQREQLCGACRAVLHDQHGVPFGVYLDGHRDSPGIIQFFVGNVWKVSASIRVWFYDSLDYSELEVRACGFDYVDVECGTGAEARAAVLHVYNQTSATGKGYHFDALLDASVTGYKGKERMQAEDGAERVSAKGTQATILHGENAVATAKAPENALSSLALREVQDLQALLQTFFESREARITVHLEDACEVIACWQDRQALCTKLHTLQQSGLAYADSGWHASMRLVDQWLGYWNSCRQGPPQRLGDGTKTTSAANRDNKKAVEPNAAVTAAGSKAQQDAQEIQTNLDVIAGAPQGAPSGRKRPGSVMEHPHRWVPVKRLRKKTGEAAATGTVEDRWRLEAASMEELEGENMFILRCGGSGRQDPRQVAEREIVALSTKLNQRPTLPSQYQHLCTEREAYDLPSWHCSFRGCSYASETEKELADHIYSSHAAAFTEVCGGAIKEEDVLGMYAAAITWKCQSAAPVANVSIDRRALRSYQKSLEANNISCLLCFVCARKYPYVRSSRNQDVGWVQPVDAKNETIFGQSVADVEESLGMKTFRQKYVEKETDFAREEMNAELEAWACQVDFAAVSVQLVCCPEDKMCQKRCRPGSLCSQCWVPLCRSCKVELVRQNKQPAAALSNDMMVYYGPREAYSVEVTVMEMLCASPCLTTMICFSLEQKLWSCV